jgi:hypothetical protein
VGLDVGGSDLGLGVGGCGVGLSVGGSGVGLGVGVVDGGADGFVAAEGTAPQALVSRSASPVANPSVPVTAAEKRPEGAGRYDPAPLSAAAARRILCAALALDRSPRPRHGAPISAGRDSENVDANGDGDVRRSCAHDHRH